MLPAGSAAAASATPDGEEGVLLLMAGKVPVHFVLVAGPAVVAASKQGAGITPAADAALAEALTAYEAVEMPATADALAPC